MKDITANIKKAISADVLWSVGDFYWFMECLDIIEFEVGLPEEDVDWFGYVYSGRTLIAYVWKRYPLIFIKKNYPESVRKLIETEFCYISIVELDDLYTKSISVDIDNDLNDRIRFHFDPKAFSAEDFWFYNVT